MRNKWGIGIAIFYGSFMAAIIGFVIFSKGQNIDLVRDDYYQGDIEYQGKLNRMKNASNLAKDVSIKIDSKTRDALIEFPVDMKNITGNIVFYKPDNKKLDFKLPINLEEGNSQRTSMTIREKGRWKVNIDWQENGVDYFSNGEIYNQ